MASQKRKVIDTILKARDYFNTKAQTLKQKPNARIAAIRDFGGGMRVVVGAYHDLKPHVGPDELLFVVPHVRVIEPVEWDDIPKVIHLAEIYLSYRLSGDNPCGDCRVCCTILNLESQDGRVKKPANQTCQHCSEKFGCQIHAVRPQECREFECSWLISQRSNDPMPDSLRPDVCGVMFTHDTIDGTEEVFEVHPDLRRTDDIFANPELQKYIDEQQKMGRKAKLITHYVGGGQE